MVLACFVHVIQLKTFESGGGIIIAVSSVALNPKSVFPLNERLLPILFGMQRDSPVRFFFIIGHSQNDNVSSLIGK